MVYRKNGCAFGDTVAVKHLNAETFKEVCHLLIEGCAAGNYHIKLAAKLGEDHLLEETVEGTKAHLVATSVKADETLYETCGELALLVNTLENSSVEGLNVERHCNEVSGLVLGKLLEDILNTGGNINIASNGVLSVDGNG